MKYARSVALALCSTWMLLVFSAPVAAKPDFAAKEKETCPTCHVMAEFAKRNDVGECYKRNVQKNLAECKKNPKK